jgi:hypothetical protein
MSRSNRNCLYCGAALPDNLVLTKEEIEMQNRRLEEANRQDVARQKLRSDINWFNRLR